MRSARIGRPADVLVPGAAPRLAHREEHLQAAGATWLVASERLESAREVCRKPFAGQRVFAERIARASDSRCAVPRVADDGELILITDPDVAIGHVADVKFSPLNSAYAIPWSSASLSAGP